MVRFFDAADVAIAAAGTSTRAHGLGVAPEVVQISKSSLAVAGNVADPRVNYGLTDAVNVSVVNNDAANATAVRVSCFAYQGRLY